MKLMISTTRSKFNSVFNNPLGNVDLAIIITIIDRFTSNFGVRGVMDRLHGTDDAFRRSRSYDRNFILFGLTSAREMFPDPPKTKQNGHCHRNSSGGIPTITEVSYPS